MDVFEGHVVGETKLGPEGGQNFLLDLIHRVTGQTVDLQRLADLAANAHSKQHFQLLQETDRKKKQIKKPEGSVVLPYLDDNHFSLAVVNL